MNFPIRRPAAAILPRRHLVAGLTAGAVLILTLLPVNAALADESTYPTHNGQKTESALQDELRNAGYQGPWDLASELNAYDRATTPPPVGPSYKGQAPASCAPTTTASGKTAYNCVYPDQSGATWRSQSDATLLASRDGPNGTIQYTPAGLPYLTAPQPVTPATAPIAAPGPIPTFGAVTATITNDFSGYGFDRVFVLDNGEVWQQTEAWSWAWSWSRPAALIYPTAGGWKLHVDNIDHDVFVQRLK